MKRGVGPFWLRGMVMVTLAFLLSACSGVASETSDPPSANGAAAADTDVDDISSALPADFPVIFYQDAGLEKDEQVMFSELVAEGKPVVLNFWAGLCPPCRAEMPAFQAISDEYEDRILMFGLDVGPFVGLGSEESGRALLEELSISCALGMGLVLVAVTIGSALFQGTVARWLRKAIPYVHRASALFLVAAGAYLAYYWLFIVGLTF